ncbi:imidazolonepropionase-like domain-containing protein [Streptomyces sp. NPDC091292]|uniref:imidazolonepropionase-like domain-containing protein n=1 Tax=Streptomyces sp. NPDC091292 TaxID=3365991 RepID=UPI003806CFFA
MLTIHTADAVRVAWDAEPLAGAAVAVRGDRIAGIGALGALRERFPGARVREWGGVLGPGRVHVGALPDAPTPRERVHLLLRAGVVGVVGEYVESAAVRSAVERGGLLVLGPSEPGPVLAEGGRADLAVLDEGGGCVATVCAGRLVHRLR